MYRAQQDTPCPMDPRAKDVLDFWFSDESRPKWYHKDPAFDESIREKFLSLYEDARNRKLEPWLKSRESAIALIIILDQFPRNMFRNSPQAFATDPLAELYAREAVKRGYNTKDSKTNFILLPFMHSESPQTHEEAMKLYEEQGDTVYEKKHKDIIDKYGRYPHRNESLGRDSTPEEIEFMKTNTGF